MVISHYLLCALSEPRCNVQDNLPYIVFFFFSIWTQAELASLAASQPPIVSDTQVREKRGGVGDKGRWRGNDEPLSKVAV